MILRNDDARHAWRWLHFRPEEFACRHCDELLIDTDFMDRLETLRITYGRPMRINSGYRCPDHNKRVSTTGPRGPHTRGAADIAVTGADAYRLLTLAPGCGLTGIGVNQKGPIPGRYIHLDSLPNAADCPRPTCWSY